MPQHPKVWQHGLFPLQSPLLRESLLVSFPPLNYMLKFGGSSCLIGDPSWGGGVQRGRVLLLYIRARFFFKILMIHWILQFALRIAFRCVLHRCGSQDIRR
jgi:hypothetical protein